MIVLSLLSESDLYGYQLVQTVSERSGGVIKIQIGSLYPCLLYTSSPRSSARHIWVTPQPGHFHPVTKRNTQGKPPSFTANSAYPCLLYTSRCV